MPVLTSDRLYGNPSSLADLNDCVLNSSQGKQYIFHRRESILFDSSSLWQISSGVVRVSMIDEDGIYISLGFWGSGDIVGRFQSGIIPCQIECLTEVEAIALHSLVSCSPSALIAHVQQMEEFLRIIQLRSVKKRLIRFLLWLFRRFGQDTLDGTQLNFHLTHEEIAETIGSTRVTVTRALKKLQQEGFLRWSRQDRLLLNNAVYCSALSKDLRS
jgi:CRP-like cAMP-binding protein